MSKRQGPSDGVHCALLKSGKNIVNVGAMVGAKWSKDRLYLLFAGQQYMDISGNEAELIWSALCRLSVDASTFGLGDRVHVGQGEVEDD